MKVLKYLNHVYFCLFIVDINKQIRDFEGKLASTSHSFAPHSVFPSSLEAQIMDFTDKIKGLN